MLNGQRADQEMYPVQVIQHRRPANPSKYDKLYNEALAKRERR